MIRVLVILLLKQTNTKNLNDFGTCDCDLNPKMCDFNCCCDDLCPQSVVDEWQKTPSVSCSDFSKFCELDLNFRANSDAIYSM